MSDQWETFCDVGYYHMWRLRRKNERGWNDGFHINTKAEAEGLCELLNKLEREVDEARKLLDAERKHHWETTVKWNGHHMELTMVQCDLNKSLRERDEAREERDTAQKALFSTVEDYEEAIEQRDRLAEELKEAQDAIEMMLKDSACRRISAYTKKQLAAVEGGSDD